MTSATGTIYVTEEVASGMMRIMKAMKSNVWTLPDTHEFIEGNVRRKQNTGDSSEAAPQKRNRSGHKASGTAKTSL